MFDLTGKTALVTGASGGIGRAIAEALHARGATVVLSGTRRDALDALAAQLGARAPVVACDLTDVAAVEGLVPAAEAAAGAPVDILVNNAGITRDNLSMRMKDEEWNDVLAVNLTTGFRLARTCLKGMMRRRYGRIIAVTSVVGTAGNAGAGELRRLQGRHGRHDEEHRGGSRRAQRHRQLHRAGVHRNADDRRPQREAEDGDPGRRADGSIGAGERRRRRGRLPRQRGGCLRDGADAPRQRWNGNDLSALALEPISACALAMADELC